MQNLASVHHAADIIVHIHPHKMFRDILLDPKDPTQNIDKSGVIYPVKFGYCDSRYVGERGNVLKRTV